MDSPLCTACGHAEHAPGPCTGCAAANTTCWQAIQVTGGDGDTSLTGRIEMARGTEQRPCMMCRRWLHAGSAKVIEHLMARGLEVQPDGTFKTPIAKDIPGRKSLVLDPKNFGFCDRDQIITESLATCANWVPTKRLTDFQQRMRRR